MADFLDEGLRKGVVTDRMWLVRRTWEAPRRSWHLSELKGGSGFELIKVGGIAEESGKEPGTLLGEPEEYT